MTGRNPCWGTWQGGSNRYWKAGDDVLFGTRPHGLASTCDDCIWMDRAWGSGDSVSDSALIVWPQMVSQRRIRAQFLATRGTLGLCEVKWPVGDKSLVKPSDNWGKTEECSPFLTEACDPRRFSFLKLMKIRNYYFKMRAFRPRER